MLCFYPKAYMKCYSLKNTTVGKKITKRILIASSINGNASKSKDLF